MREFNEWVHFIAHNFSTGTKLDISCTSYREWKGADVHAISVRCCRLWKLKHILLICKFTYLHPCSKKNALHDIYLRNLDKKILWPYGTRSHGLFDATYVRHIEVRPTVHTGICMNLLLQEPDQLIR